MLNDRMSDSSPERMDDKPFNGKSPYRRGRRLSPWGMRPLSRLGSSSAKQNDDRSYLLPYSDTSRDEQAARTGLVLRWILLLCIGIFILFAHGEWIPLRPTPPPDDDASADGARSVAGGPPSSAMSQHAHNRDLWMKLTNRRADSSSRYSDNVTDKARRQAVAWREQYEKARLVSLHRHGEESGAHLHKLCHDELPGCATWAKHDQCRQNVAFMKDRCPRSCGFCETTDLRSVAPSMIDARNRSGTEGGGGGTQQPSASAPSGAHCIDTNPSCERWAQHSQCERNPRFMSTSCPKACGLCVPTAGADDSEVAGADDSEVPARKPAAVVPKTVSGGEIFIEEGTNTGTVVSGVHL